MALEVIGNGAEALDNEAGGHRIQRVPPTERKGRVHTSTVTVAVLKESNATVDIKDSDIRVEWYSGSGAGGQHRNKHQNSCRLIHIPTGTVRKAETRNRESSYRDARQALAEAIQGAQRSGQHQAQNGVRRAQVGSGMRGDKRRTYRFQENSVSDHVNGTTAICSEVMRGNFDQLWR